MISHRIKLRRDRFEHEAQRRGLDSQTDQARAIGVHTSIHHRALQNQRELSGPYVIGVLLLLGDAATRRRVTELFDVAPEVAPRRNPGARRLPLAEVEAGAA